MIWVAVFALAPQLCVAADEPRLAPGLDVFAGYRATVPESDAWYHEFTLGRAHAWLDGSMGPARARVLLEAVRSAGEGALLGVAGDSLVARFREAWVGFDLFDRVEARAGLVPTLTLPAVESAEGLRPLAASPLEQGELLWPADLGATARVRLPADLGWAGAGVYNGEGYWQRDLNRGKNTEFFLLAQPLAALTWGQPLHLCLSYSNGSRGTGRARSNRTVGALWWQDKRWSGGVAMAYLQGLEQDGARSGWLGHVFLHARLWESLLLGARFTHLVRDQDAPADKLTGVLATVGWAMGRHLELYAALQRWLPGDRYQSAVPVSDRWEFQIVGRMRLGAEP
jgi:hypothetical protein